VVGDGERERVQGCRWKTLSTVAALAGGPARSSGEASVMGVERRGRLIDDLSLEQPAGQIGWSVWAGRTREGMSGSDGKSFVIPKQRVWEAYRRVAANKGAAGVDGQSIDDFEKDLRNNLYRIWNRMSSGTYFPPPVLQVDIPKADGGIRTLGLPTVVDRVAQTVVALTLEPRTESIFVVDSYGYQPRKSALDAVAACRQRCWRKGWAIDLDLQKFFDSVPWELMIKAVRANITQEQRWVLLYVRHWLAAPMQTRDGVVIERDRGTPQGNTA
jgi:RNA-directed DNA polymerase